MAYSTEMVKAGLDTGTLFTGVPIGWDVGGAGVPQASIARMRASMGRERRFMVTNTYCNYFPGIRKRSNFEQQPRR
jgi:hypothetical protein